MKVALIVLSVLDVLMIGSTLLCGMWIRAKEGLTPAAESVGFHTTIAWATSILVLITLGIAVFKQ